MIPFLNEPVDGPPQGYGFCHRRYRPSALYQDPGQYSGEEAIAVSCTQLADRRRQVRLVKAWGEALPTLQGVKRFFFASHFPKGLFEPVCRMPNLEELYVKWSNLTTIGPIVALSRLRALHLGSSPSIGDPEIVRSLPGLNRLSLENIRAVRDLDWLREMPPLQELNLCGGMDSVQRLSSLRPLASLVKLERIELFGARVADKSSLMTLAELPALRSVGTAWWWPKGALRELAKARPDVWINGQRWPDWQDHHER